MAHGVAHNQTAKAVQGVTGIGVKRIEQSHTAQGGQGQYVGQVAPRAGDQQVSQRNHAGHDQQHDFRVHRHPAG